MTKEEAIKRIEEGAPFSELYDREWEEALSMAIKALEQQPCEDAISRQTVIDSIRNYFHDEYYQRTSIQDCRDCLIEDVIKSLPPVTPIRPKGEWLPTHEYLAAEGGSIDYVKCSCCERWSLEQDVLDFCPYCGADMRGENG